MVCALEVVNCRVGGCAGLCMLAKVAVWCWFCVGFMGFAANGSGLSGNGRRLAGFWERGRHEECQEGGRAGQRAAPETQVAGESTVDGSKEKREPEMG